MRKKEGREHTRNGEGQTAQEERRKEMGNMCILVDLNGRPASGGNDFFRTFP